MIDFLQATPQQWNRQGELDPLVRRWTQRTLILVNPKLLWRIPCQQRLVPACQRLADPGCQLKLVGNRPHSWLQRLRGNLYNRAVCSSSPTGMLGQDHRHFGVH